MPLHCLLERPRVSRWLPTARRGMMGHISHPSQPMGALWHFIPMLTIWCLGILTIVGTYSCMREES